MDVDGRPFAEYQLDWLRDEGVTHVVYCLGHLGEQVVDALGTGDRWGMRFDFVMDGPTLLGTGGALRRAMPPRADEFFVLYGDSLLTCDLACVERAFEASGRTSLMTVVRNDNRWDRSNVVFKDGEIVVYDKTASLPDMHYIDYGLGILSSRVLLSYAGRHAVRPRSASIRISFEAGQLTGYDVGTRFYEIGSPAGLEDTRQYLATRRRRDPTDDLYTNSTWTKPSRITQALDADAIDRVVRRWRACASAAAGCSFSGSAAARGTLRTPSTTSASSPASRPMPRPTTCRSSRRAPMTRAGRRSSSRGSGAAGCGRKMASSCFSVGGGNLEKNISPNLVRALEYAQSVGATIVGIVGRDGGYTAKAADGLRDRADGESRHGDATFRGVPGGRLASAGVAPGAEGARDQMGIDAVTQDRQDGGVDAPGSARDAEPRGTSEEPGLVR